MSELRACPFCGGDCHKLSGDGFPEMCIYKTQSISEFRAAWQHRPIEDALRAELELERDELRKAREHRDKLALMEANTRAELVDEMTKHGATIKELYETRAELAALRESTRWISVDERLPEDGNYCFVTDGKRVCETQYHRDVWGGFMELAVVDVVTHWRPLPAPQEAE